MGSGSFLFFFVFSTLVDYVVGLFIDRNKGRSSARWWLIFSIIFNLSLLAYFKYSNFFIANFNGGLFHLGVKPIGWTKVILPIGISFFTFHKISYIVDTLDSDSKLFLVLKRMTTFLLVMVGWVLFRADSLTQAKVFFNEMFALVQMPVPLEIILVLNSRNVFFLLIAALVLFLPRDFSGAGFLLKGKPTIIAVPQLILILLLVFYSITALVSGSYNPFIYFQF